MWLIRVEVQQKTATFCKAILLQLKKKKKVYVLASPPPVATLTALTPSSVPLVMNVLSCPRLVVFDSLTEGEFQA